MFVKDITIEPPLDITLESEFARRLYYLTDTITSYKTQVIDDMVTNVQLTFKDDIDEDIIKSKVNKLLDFDIRKKKISTKNRVWESKYTVNYNDRIFSEMVDSGIVYEQAPGQMIFNDTFITLMDYIDKKINKIIKKRFKAIEFKYPTLIPTEVIKKCGYIDNYPQHIMYTTYLHNDIDTYVEFKEHLNQNNCIPGALFSKYCKNKDYCLPPAMCYYTYNQFADKVFGPDDNITVTSKGKSFRYESKYANSIERLTDFTIRETVYMGDNEYVNNSRELFMKQIYDLMHHLKLRGFCVEKSHDEDDKKYELHINIEEDKSISVGAFNYHSDFFSKKFNLTFADGKYIKTGCAGFGLERFAYAFICQHGIDKKRWPINI